MMKTYSELYQHHQNKRYKYVSQSSNAIAIDTSTSSSASASTPPSETSSANESTSSSTPPLSPLASPSTTTLSNQSANPNVLCNSNLNKFNKTANFSNPYVAAAAAAANCNQMLQRNYYGSNSMLTSNGQDYENYPVNMMQKQQQHQLQPQQQQQYYNYYANNLNTRSTCSSARSSLNSTDSLSLTPSSANIRATQQQIYDPTNEMLLRQAQVNTTQPLVTDETSSTAAYRNVNISADSIIQSSTSSTSSSLPLKKRRAVPSEMKDNTYWEKRRKNNESAKRSRDNKRSKEETLMMRNLYLEQENLQLKTQIAMYESQIENLSRIAHGLGGHIVGTNATQNSN